MKIRDKLLIGFAVLIGFIGVWNILKIVQFDTMNNYYSELINVDSKAMDLMQQLL